MNADADAAQLVDPREESGLFGSRFLTGPFHFNGQEIAETNFTLADHFHALRQNAQDVGHAAQADKTPITTAFPRNGTLILPPNVETL